MARATQTQRETLYAEAPATAAVSDPIHNLIQTLSVKLDAVWRYDKYLADCRDDQSCGQIYRKMKDDDLEHVRMLRDEIDRHCREGSFR
ncbi:MAG: hypothetical protein GEU73_01685 [Chloroflexi bacterium]|nr:hypothetical protein [Chloroflexota bacterium]